MILLEFRHVTHYRSNEFYGFHTYGTNRGLDSWKDRWDWRSINGIFKSKDLEGDIKKSQLRAIKSVIAGKDAAHNVSSYTPICSLITTSGKKFMIGDNGSMGMGDEMNGVVCLIISPKHAIFFFRPIKAVEIMTKLGVKNDKSTILYEEADDEFVDLINQRVLQHSFEYYIDPNKIDDDSATSPEASK